MPASCTSAISGFMGSQFTDAMPRRFKTLPKVLKAKAKRGTVNCTNGGRVEIALPAIRIPVSTGGGSHINVLTSSTPPSFHYIPPVLP